MLLRTVKHPCSDHLFWLPWSQTMPPFTTTIRSLVLALLQFRSISVDGSTLTYQSESHFSGPGFFDNFDFFTVRTSSIPFYILPSRPNTSLMNRIGLVSLKQDPDPTHGFVTYVTKVTASTLGLISTSQGGAYIGVDHTSVLSTSGLGRKSVRISSKEHGTTGCSLSI